MAAISLVLGALALLGGAYFTSNLVASLAYPVSLILAGAAGLIGFVKLNRQEILEDVFSSEEGELIGTGLISAAVFLLVFAAGQSLITALSPLAGIIVVGLGVAVFFFGTDFLFASLGIVVEAFTGGEN